MLGAGIVVVDDLAEASGKLRVHVVEQFIQQQRVFVVTGENDGFTWQLAVPIFQAIFHQVTQDGVFVINCLIQRLAIKFQRIRIDTLFFKFADLFVA
ncbi:Uncharacterised protein [Klebsiella pneumoniae]|nr:Uncharacterised protein [Klebsiella pneumoniae]